MPWPARAASILSRKVMPVGAETAWVDPDKCIACMTCVHVCPYMAPQIGENNKAEVQAAVCMGCGSCTAACPAKAISLHHYLDTQILGAINSLLARFVRGKAGRGDVPRKGRHRAAEGGKNKS